MANVPVGVFKPISYMLKIKSIHFKMKNNTFKTPLKKKTKFNFDLLLKITATQTAVFSIYKKMNWRAMSLKVSKKLKNWPKTQLLYTENYHKLVNNLFYFFVMAP